MQIAFGCVHRDARRIWASTPQNRTTTNRVYPSFQKKITKFGLNINFIV